MSWKRTLRSIERQVKRQERDARRRATEAKKAWKEAVKTHALETARLEVEAFEAQIDELTSLHRECAEPVDWNALLSQPCPAAPSAPEEVSKARSSRAKAALAGYRPTFFERLLSSQSRKLQLEVAVTRAHNAEIAEAKAREADHAKAMEDWKIASEQWQETHELAKRVVAGDDKALADAITATGCLAELLGSLGSDEERVTVANGRADLVLVANEDTVVPVEQKTLTARGAASSKKFPVARRMEIYQDYVCGAALRAGREIMAVTPLDAVLVHVEATQLDTSTGHNVPRTILSVLCTRETLASVNWDKVDASDLVERMTHKMKLTRGKGFQPVERLGTTVQRS